MVDYKRMHFVHFNVLFAHLFWSLSKSQSMSKLLVNVCKLITVASIMDGSFPALKSTNNERTPMVSTRTVGYILAIIINCVTLQMLTPPTLVHSSSINRHGTI